MGLDLTGRNLPPRDLCFKPYRHHFLAGPLFHTSRSRSVNAFLFSAGNFARFSAPEGVRSGMITRPSATYSDPTTSGRNAAVGGNFLE